MIHSDIFLEIGSQHSVCEDYIIHGNDPFPYIILSDGCSSSNNTEMGARILCHLAKQFLKLYKGDLPMFPERLGLWVIHNAEMTARQLGLTFNCLDATLIVSYYYEDAREIRTMIFGDGCVIEKRKDVMTFQSISYKNNAPYYLTYDIDDLRRELYDGLAISKSLHHIDTLGTNIREGTFTYSACDFVHKVDDNFESLLISSDGLESFLNTSESPPSVVPAMEVGSQLLQFKNTKGEFLKRRAKKQMSIYRGTENINHYDDLSVGVFLKD